MNPRRAGWIAAAIVFAVITALVGATAVARNADPSSYTVGAGESVLSLAFSSVPAVAAGLFVAAVTRSARGRLAAITVAIGTYLAFGALTWSLASGSPRSPEEDQVRYALEIITGFATVGTTFAIAAAVVAWWVACHAVRADGSERVLALATTSLRGSRGEWGAAMRAELASIDGPAERRRFARSAALLALRRGTSHWPLVLAAGVGVCAGIVVFVASRVSFDRELPGQRGIIGEPLMQLLPLLVIAAVIVGALLGRSFRAALETAVLAWLATYVCTVAVEIPEALRWYYDDGIFLLDGDGVPRTGGGALDAALEPITHGAFILTSVALLVVAVLAAALGALVLRIGRRVRRRRAAAAAPSGAMSAQIERAAE